MTINNRNMRLKQSGTFAIELALVGSFMALFMAFMSDMAGKQTLQGHLQRLSYSAVNIIKERTQFYSESEVVKNEEVDDLFNIINNSMSRSMSGFKNTQLGMVLEQVRFDDDGDFVEPAAGGEPGTGTFSRGLSCTIDNNRRLRELTDLHIQSPWGDHPTLYQTTLCYKGDNWFGSALGDGSDYSLVQTHSIMLGR